MELVGIYSSDKMIDTPNGMDYSLDIVPWYLDFNTEYRGLMTVTFDSDRWTIHKSARFSFMCSKLILGGVVKNSNYLTSQGKDFFLDRFNLDVQPNLILKGPEDFDRFDYVVSVFLFLDAEELFELFKFLNREKPGFTETIVLPLT